jgi:hypothetical protein
VLPCSRRPPETKKNPLLISSKETEIEMHLSLDNHEQNYSAQRMETNQNTATCNTRNVAHPDPGSGAF